MAFLELDSGGIYLLAQISIYVFQSLFMLIFGLMVQNNVVSDTPLAHMIVGDIVMCINAAVFILTPFIYGRFTGVSFAGELDMKRGVSPVQVLLLIVIAWCSIVAFMPVSSLFIELFKVLGYSYDMSIPNYFDNVGVLILAIIFIALLPAIGEEIMFRGFVARGLRKFGIVGAFLLSSLIFATAHGNLLQLVYQFFLGLVLVTVYFATRSIYASIIVHFTNNATALIINYVLYHTTGSAEFDLPLEGAGLVFAMLGISLVGIVLLCLLLWAFLHITKKGQDAYISSRKVDISEYRVYGRHNKKGANFITRYLDFIKYLNYSFEEQELEINTKTEEQIAYEEATEISEKVYRGNLLKARLEKNRRWDRNMVCFGIFFNLFILIVNIINGFKG